MPDRTTKFLDSILKSINGFSGVYFGGPEPRHRNPCIVYAITGDERYPLHRNPDRVIAIDYQVTVRSDDASQVEQLGRKVWDALRNAGSRIRDIGEYRVDKYLAQDETEQTASEFFATREYRVRVR